MSSSYANLIAENVKYVKRLEKSKLQMANARNHERIGIVEFVQQNFDKKINQISKQDVEFYREISQRNLAEMLEQIKRTEMETSTKLRELIEEYNQQNRLEKENADVACCLTTTNKGRKRKLPLQRSVDSTN